MNSFFQKSNLPEYTVSEVSGAIKKTLENNFSHIRVRGEVTECKSYSSGHIYYSLKDEDSRISAVVWRSQVGRLGLKPEDGMDVIITGRISSYHRNSRYQIITEDVEYAGVGAMLARIEKLRKKLSSEGIFSDDHKKTLPFLPKTIAVITSAQGAVIHDICTTLQRRFPTDVMLWPVPVQGEGAAEKIERALKNISLLPSGLVQTIPDIVIVARGGGSVEELMPFSDENVVRAAFECPIPIISAVGHETDHPLIDDVADRRAPTPTAAAEMSVPVRKDLIQSLNEQERHAAQNLGRILREAKRRLQDLSFRMPDLQSITREASHQLQTQSEQLNRSIEDRLRNLQLRLFSVSLPSLQARFQQRQHVLWQQQERLTNHMQNKLREKKFEIHQIYFKPQMVQEPLRRACVSLNNISQRLNALSPFSILDRGYALVTKKNGHPVTKAHGLKNHEAIDIMFSDGKRGAVIRDGKKNMQGELNF